MNPFDPANRIDREVGERGRRLIIGLYTDPQFQVISGSVVVIEGKGKYLKAVCAATCDEQIPQMTREILFGLMEREEFSLLDLRAAQNDICLMQHSLVSQLKIEAGKYLDRLLTIAVMDSGIRLGVENPGKHYVSVSEPEVLAESSGISVIDAFPKKDIAAGGNGKGLFALPAWILLSDRSRTVAKKNRVLVNMAHNSEIVYLPASDGLDVEIPDIGFVSAAGLNFLSAANGNDDLRELSRLSTMGKYSDSISRKFRTRSFEPKTLDASQNSREDTARTSVVELAQIIVECINNVSGARRVDQIVLDCPEPIMGAMINQIERELDGIEVVSNFIQGGRAGRLCSVLTAILGAMSVDQMPANIPAITGAGSTKILGRITPGTPSNWRQLLREMSDFQPPAMRLRDAV